MGMGRVGDWSGGSVDGERLSHMRDPDRSFLLNRLGYNKCTMS